MIFDTDVLIWVQRANSNARQLINQTPNRFIAIVTYLELIQGATDKRHLNALSLFLQKTKFEVLPLTEEIGQRALALLTTFRLSHHMSSADALIAATAIEHGLPLCSGNAKHFRQIPQLNFQIFKP